MFDETWRLLAWMGVGIVVFAAIRWGPRLIERRRRDRWESAEATITSVKLRKRTGDGWIPFELTVEAPLAPVGTVSKVITVAYRDLEAHLAGLPPEPVASFWGKPRPEDQAAFEAALVGRTIPVLISPRFRRIVVPRA
jgi:hypothetical protein